MPPAIGEPIAHAGGAHLLARDLFAGFHAIGDSQRDGAGRLGHLGREEFRESLPWIASLSSKLMRGDAAYPQPALLLRPIRLGQPRCIVSASNSEMASAVDGPSQNGQRRS